MNILPCIVEYNYIQLFYVAPGHRRKSQTIPGKAFLIRQVTTGCSPVIKDYSSSVVYTT